MQALTSILAIAVLVVAAYGDICRRLIPNELAIAIAILGLARTIIAGDPSAFLLTLVSGGAVLFVGFLCFWYGWIGGGDAKLLSAVVLLVGYRSVPDLLFIMSFAGGIVALIVLALHKLRPFLPPLSVVLGSCGAPVRFALAVEHKLGWVPPLVQSRVPDTAVGNAAAARPSVPYGVAIAAAGVTVLALQFTFRG